MVSNAQSLVFALSEDYARATGGYAYDTRLVAELQALGWAISSLPLPPGFPRPDLAARRRTAELFAGLPDGTLLLTDQLCLSVLPDLARAEAQRLRLVVIVHHPLAREGYGAADLNAALFASEAEALRHAALVIVTSKPTAATLLAAYAVPAERLLIALPGTDAFPQTPPHDGSVVRLLSVGAVVPRKGHDLLVGALSDLRDLPWHVTIAGNVDRAPEHVSRLRELIKRANIGDRITLAGELSPSALEEQWLQADLFVSASRHEGFGMAIAEAVARGLPVIATNAGAVASWLPDTAAAIVPDMDPQALGNALRRALSDPDHRSALRDGARAFRSQLPTWTDSARLVAERLSPLV